MANSALDYMKDILAAPLGELISSIGSGVAEAQAAMDAASLAQTLEIYSDSANPLAKQLREIGYQPTFYALPETEVEAQVAFSLAATGSSGTPVAGNTSGGRARVYAAPVNASVANKYNMEASASAKLKFKIVPVPPQGNIAEMRVAPTLVGKKLSEAETILNSLNLSYESAPDIDGNPPVVDGESVIVAQQPEGGTVIGRDEAITLGF